MWCEPSCTADRVLQKGAQDLMTNTCADRRPGADSQQRRPGLFGAEIAPKMFCSPAGPASPDPTDPLNPPASFRAAMCSMQK